MSGENVLFLRLHNAVTAKGTVHANKVSDVTLCILSLGKKPFREASKTCAIRRCY